MLSFLGSNNKQECLDRLVTRFHAIALKKHNAGDEETAGRWGQIYFALKNASLDEKRKVLQQLITSNTLPIEIRNTAEFVLYANAEDVVGIDSVKSWIPKKVFSPARIAVASVALFFSPLVTTVSSSKGTNVNYPYNPEKEFLTNLVSSVPVDTDYVVLKFAINKESILLNNILGFRSFYNKKTKEYQARPHPGIDVACGYGTKVYAMHEGVVTFIGLKTGYGKVVEIDYGNGYSSVFAHGSRFSKDIHKGDKVNEETIVMYSGKSGNATGPTLHIEIHKNKEPINPLTDERVIYRDELNFSVKNCVRKEQRKAYKQLQEILDSQYDQNQEYRTYVETVLAKK